MHCHCCISYTWIQFDGSRTVTPSSVNLTETLSVSRCSIHYGSLSARETNVDSDSLSQSENDIHFPGQNLGDDNLETAETTRNTCDNLKTISNKINIPMKWNVSGETNYLIFSKKRSLCTHFFIKALYNTQKWKRLCCHDQRFRNAHLQCGLIHQTLCRHKLWR